MLQKFLKVLLLSYSLIFSSFAASTREIGFDIGTLGTQGSTPSNPTSGKNKLYVKDGNLKLLDSTGSEKDIGSGESDNFIPDPGTELVNPTCAAYADTAGVLPVDGTGGSPTVSVAHSATNPLSGKRSLVFTKTAANSQGQGFSCAFTIDNASKGKVLRTQFDYEISSGTYASADAKVFIYDVTNARVIEPSSSVIENSGVKETKFAEWQSSIDSISYRLIVHVTSTSASAYSLKFDSFKTSRGPKVYGSVTTDWASFTPTGSWTTNATYTGKWRKVGDSAEFEVNIATTGAPTATPLILNIPFGWMIDANKSALLGDFGIGSATDTGIFAYSIRARAYTPTQVSIGVANTAASYPQMSSVTSTAPFSFGAGDAVNIRFSVPIQGWSSSQQLSQDADTRVVSARYSLLGTQVLNDATNTTVIWNNKQVDTHGGMNTSTGVYTFKIPGQYKIGASLGLGTSISQVSGNRTAMYYKINGGTLIKIGGMIVAGSVTETFQFYGSDIINVVAGDTIELVAYYDFSASTYNLQSVNSGVTFFNLERLSGPSQIAASESVTASYWLSANFVASTATPINFDSREFDSHNAVTTSPTAWRFTAPISGVYNVSGYVTLNTTYLKLYKNGSALKGLSYSTLSNPSGGFSTSVRLLAGEYVDFRPAISATATGGTMSADGVSNVSITRIGNY